MSQKHTHWFLILSGATPSSKDQVARLPARDFLFLTDSMIDGQSVRRWYDRLYEDGFGSDDELSVWSYRPWLSPHAWIPYRDDDFGWRDSTIRWIPRGPADHVVPPEGEPNPWAGAEKSARTLTETPLSKDLLFNGLKYINADVLHGIIQALLPDPRLAPLHDFWRREREGGKTLEAITALSQTCRLWHRTVHHSPDLWAGVGPAATSVHSWNIVSSRACDAPMRIAYRGTIPWKLLDRRLQQARAAYAGAECSWREFGREVLADFNDMPNVEVLFLRPNILDSTSSVMKSPSHSVFCPSLRFCSVNAPILVTAPVLESLAVANHTSAQLTDLLTPLRTLRRLDIGAVSGDRIADFSSLLSVTVTDRLEFLRIRTKRDKNDVLNIHSTPLLMSCLTLLDVSTPVCIDAPAVEFARVYDVHAAELLHMLSRMSGTIQLYTCWREGPIRHSVHLPSAAAFLPELREIYLAGEISSDTVDFFRGIQAPALIGVQAFVDVREPPSHDTLSSLIGRVRTALDAHGTDAGRLRDELDETQDALRGAGYFLLADTLDDILMPGLTDDFEGPEPEHTIAEYVSSATNILTQLREALQSPPVPHGGYLVREVAFAAMHAAGVVMGADEDVHVHIYEDVRAVHLDVLFKGNQRRRLRFSAAGPHNCFSNRPWDAPRLDSAVYSIARVLYGLHAFRPRYLCVNDSAFAGVLPENLGTGDVAMLREVLQAYDIVHTLHIDHSHGSPSSNSPGALVEVLHSAPTLPKLQTLTVSVLYEEMGSPIWQQLESMLVGRFEGENGVAVVAVDGHGCIPAGWAKRVRSVVGSLDTTRVVCAIDPKMMCFACQCRSLVE